MPNKAIFLDRDDTLIEDPGYINSPEQVKLIEGVVDALVELKKMGYKLVVVSNQSAVARGITTEQTLQEIHRRLEQLLAIGGAQLDKIYYCPFHPDGVIPKYRRDSDFRKPSPGMILQACQELNIDPAQSWAIGNSESDIEAGIRAGCKTILLDGPLHNKKLQNLNIKSDYAAVNMKEAVNIIKQQNRSPKEKDTRPPIMANQTIQFIPPAKSQSSPQPPQPHDDIPPAITPRQDTKPPEPPIKENAPQVPISNQSAEQILNHILEHLKAMSRSRLFDEFSIIRLLAGAIQVAAVFCVLLSIWFLLSPQKQYNHLYISLSFAGILQLMALTFYIMQGRK